MRLIDPKTAEKFVTIQSEDGTVFLLPASGKIADLEAGIIITCSECGKKEIVNKNSLCHRLRLCTEHARKRLKR